MEWRIGCSGFYNRHWKEIFYPDGLRQKDWFSYYAQQLTTLEINTTFYKFPTPEKLKVWFDQSPETFRFTVKAPRLITHFKKMNDCRLLLDDFYSACHEGLQHKLSCVLFQFPPLFDFQPLRLELLIDNLQSPFHNVVEFRNRSWWEPWIIESLAAAGIIFCSPDHPAMPDELIINQNTAYIRWHGNPLLFYSAYSRKKMQKVIKEVRQYDNLKEVYFYFNNTASTAGILNALELQKIVSLLK